MSQLDQALEACLNDATLQDEYYRLILDSDFFVPLQSDDGDTPLDARESVRPLIVSAEKKHYMMLFDSEERLNDWAKQPTPFATLSGRLIASITTPALHWAVNIGSTYAKEFVPEEITYLKTLA